MSKIYCLIAQILITITHFLVPVLQFPPLQSKEIKQNRFLVCSKLHIVHLLRSVFSWFLKLGWRMNQREREWFRGREKGSGPLGLMGIFICMFQVCWLTNIRFFSLFVSPPLRHLLSLFVQANTQIKTMMEMNRLWNILYWLCVPQGGRLSPN